MTLTTSRSASADRTMLQGPHSRRRELLLVAPNARELTRALRHPDVSIVVDLSKVRHREKVQYVETAMDLLLRLRRQTGLPHRIVVDEAHYLTARKPSWARNPEELRGLTLITYRVSSLMRQVSLPEDAVMMVTKESDPPEIETLGRLCRPKGFDVATNALADLLVNEAAILPGSEESCGCVLRFEIAQRLTAHVRHRTKYLDMPVNEWQAFVFTDDGRPVARAQTLKEFVGLIMTLPTGVVKGHLVRHDFSRWLDSVFRDGVLAGRIRALETTIDHEAVHDVVLNMDQTIRARYERISSDLAVHAAAAS